MREKTAGGYGAKELHAWTEVGNAGKGKRLWKRRQGDGLGKEGWKRDYSPPMSSLVLYLSMLLANASPLQVGCAQSTS